MKVVFRGDPVEIQRGEGLSRQSLSLWGFDFRMGEVVDVSRMPEAQKAKLRTNAHFEVVADRPESRETVTGGGSAGATVTRAAGSGGKSKKSGTVKAAENAG